MAQSEEYTLLYNLISEKSEEINQNIKNVCDDINKQLTNIRNRVGKIETQIDNNKASTDTNAKKIGLLEAELKELKEQMTVNVKTLDDQVNGNMRTTLVFRGVPETENKDDWEATTDHLAKPLCQTDESFTKNEIINDIERAHRKGEAREGTV